MVLDRIDELEDFYDENRSDLSWYGADEHPEVSVEYNNKVQEVAEEVADEYGTEEGEYSGRLGEMLAERVCEELEVPMGGPVEGHQEPDFDKARSLLGE